MEILGKYYDSIEEINSILTLKKISVIREFFGAYAADVQITEEYVRLSIKTRGTLRSFPDFLNECTEFLIYPDENGMNIDLYFYVKE